MDGDSHAPALADLMTRATDMVRCWDDGLGVGPATCIHTLRQLLPLVDAQAVQLAAVEELVEAAKAWATRNYLIDPSKGGLERVRRTDRLVRAARSLLVADGGTWYELSELSDAH